MIRFIWRNGVRFVIVLGLNNWAALLVNIVNYGVYWEGIIYNEVNGWILREGSMKNNSDWVDDLGLLNNGDNLGNIIDILSLYNVRGLFYIEILYFNFFNENL